MIPCDKSFNGKEYYVFEGKTFYRWHTLNDDKTYIAKFRKVSSNSNNKQAIALFFSDFEGTVYINKQKVANLKGFKHYLLGEEYFADEGLELYVIPKKGYLFFGNASESLESKTYKCGAYGCAFWIEKT